MKAKEITVRFNLENEKDKRVYYALKNLPGYFEEPDFSRAFIDFINDLIATFGECEEKREGCENMLKKVTGEHGWV